MPAPSFAAPTWATSSPPASAVLTAGLRANGYADFDPMTASGVNRWRYEVGQWLAYFDDEVLVNFEAEHYNAAGTDALGGAISAGSHKAVTCDSLSIRAEGTGNDEGGKLSFPQAGGALNNTAVIELGALGSGDCILRLDHPATDSIELEVGGGVWRSTLAGGSSWAFEVDSGSDQILYVRNIGAGVADLNIDGDLAVQTNAALGGTLAVTGSTSASGLINANGGVEVQENTVNNTFVAYDSVQTFELDVSPYGGGWMRVEVNSTGSPSHANMIPSTPPYTTPSALSTKMTLVRPLVLPVNTTTTLNASARRAITQVKLRYYRAASGAQINLELVSVARDGSGAETSVFSYDEASDFTTTAAWTLFDSGAISHTLDPATNYYFLRLTMDNGSSDGRVADVTVEYTEKHIQAPGM